MSTLATFIKQPDDEQDYDVLFAEWLESMSDTAVSQVTTVSGPDATLLLSPASALVGDYVKVWTKGGTHGSAYKITVTLTTGGGRKKQVELTIKVKET